MLGRTCDGVWKCCLWVSFPAWEVMFRFKTRAVQRGLVDNDGAWERSEKFNWTCRHHLGFSLYPSWVNHLWYTHLNNLSYMWKTPSRTNVGDWSPQSVILWDVRLTRLETSALFLWMMIPHQEFTFSHLGPFVPNAKLGRQLDSIVGAYKKALPVWGLSAVQGLNQQLWPH